ncbi:PREDICTED: nuclear fragile X mental retardation-interacting protein 1-like isoform X3 [Polistes dominula]|uniref:Nuclear fragile X mental retardation-interacting protein 1-like isoform X3 n=1 Tax=Polistes dominula TaxID=743375 RepID=A0ABM1IDJ9_POLDO|nr:PREDICTED: nuclear fragile X mental retardation-interacting protein 1-like isoform X3 [Polistes dominula]
MTRGNMSPVNRSPSIGPRIPPPGVRPLPHPRFGAIFPPGMPPRMPLPPMSGILGPMRPRLPPPCVAQPGGPPRPLLPPGRVPLPPPMPGPRGPPIMCPWPRRVLPPQMVPHMRPRFSPRNGTKKATVYTVKKVVKYEAHIERNMETKESNKESSCDKIDENNEVNKVDKVYYCEVCDREFKTEDKLTEHVSMHKICGIDGCTFSANVLLVDKHIKMQHRTGLYERMKNVSTPEDITKWIEDRKRKYPTKAKAEKKQKADDMKNIEHGETSNRVNKPIIHSRKNKQQQQQQTNTNNVVKKPKRTFRIQKKQNTTTTDVETYRGLIQFPGTACLKDIKCNESENTNDEQLKTTKCINESEQLENTFNISDEEDTTMENNSIANLTNPMKNIFMNSLVADYGSEEEEEEEGKENDECPEEVPIKKFANHSNETNIMETTVSSNNTKSNDTSNKSDKKKKKKEKEIEKEKEKENKPLSIQNKVIDKQKKYKNSSSINLLRKLLAKPIKNERNLIYQCIKYIESNNFLNV